MTSSDAPATSGELDVPDTIDLDRPHVVTERADSDAPTPIEIPVQDRDYYDRPPGDPREPRTRDLEARVATLEQADKVRASKRTWSQRALAFLLGSGLTVAAWIVTRAEERADAKATAREREDERRWLIDTVRVLERRDALQQGQLDSITDRLRYPMHGPPTAPQGSP